ncbi:hypothetical protein D3C80_1646500 [compost metagenome]
MWQYQLGYPIKRRGITVTSQGAEAYEYKLSASAALSSYNMEQQGEIISDYYMICVELDPDAVWNYNNRSKDPDLLKSVLQRFMLDPSNKANLPR